MGVEGVGWSSLGVAQRFTSANMTHLRRLDDCVRHLHSRAVLSSLGDGARRRLCVTGARY